MNKIIIIGIVLLIIFWVVCFIMRITKKKGEDINWIRELVISFGVTAIAGIISGIISGIILKIIYPTDNQISSSVNEVNNTITSNYETYYYNTDSDKDNGKYVDTYNNSNDIEIKETINDNKEIVKADSITIFDNKSDSMVVPTETTKYVCRYRSRKLITKYSENESLDGYERTGVENINWSEWSELTSNPPAYNDTETYQVKCVREEKKYEQNTGLIQYHTYKDTASGSGKYSKYAEENGKKYDYYHVFIAGPLPVFGYDDYAKENTYVFGENGEYDSCQEQHKFTKVPVYKDFEITEIITEPAMYEYRIGIKQYEFKKWEYGEWNYSSEYVEENETIEVEILD